MAPGSVVKKVAISKKGFFNIFYELDPKVPLVAVVKEICEKWGITKAEEYAIQYLDSKNYLTEENRAELKDGDVLTIQYNVELLAANYLTDIEQPDLSIKRKALAHFAGIDGAGQADDPSFAKEFIKRNGINTLVKIIENSSEPADIIAQAIVAVQELMEHGFVLWDPTVNQEFVLKILSFANKTDGTDRKIIQRSLAMLDSIVTDSSSLFVTLVMNRMKLENLVYHIKRDDAKLRLSAISLCNSIFTKMEQANRVKYAKSLSNKGYTEVLQKIIAASHSNPISGELLHQLYVYQSLLLSLFEPRMKTKPDISDVEPLATIQHIYDVAFESTAFKEKIASEKVDFKRLGFVNSTPLLDFQECPPGMLAYDVITFFAKNHQDQYVKIILENSVRDKDYECPFGRCSVQLTKILCELLNVGAPISDTGTNIQPMFFTSGDVFQELYSVSIQLLNKTWKEMRATTSDISRVLGVVKDQIRRVLNDRPDSIDKFKTKAFGMTYQQVLRLMQQEAQERTILDSQSKPVMELREHIEPEIHELVRQQRLAQLVEGQFFTHFSTKGRRKDRYWFCCLSPNYRFLHYGGDFTSSTDSTPSIENLHSKISLAEVDNIMVGRETAHAKTLRRGDIQLAFSVMYNQKDHLDFVAPSQQVFSVWTDALLSLTGKKMSSREFHEDMDMLLNMEMKLLLLDLEDVRIPEVPPPIPREPDNYNFYYRDE